MKTLGNNVVLGAGSRHMVVMDWDDKVYTPPSEGALKAAAELAGFDCLSFACVQPSLPLDNWTIDLSLLGGPGAFLATMLAQAFLGGPSVSRPTWIAELRVRGDGADIGRVLSLGSAFHAAHTVVLDEGSGLPDEVYNAQLAAQVAVSSAAEVPADVLDAIGSAAQGAGFVARVAGAVLSPVGLTLLAAAGVWWLSKKGT